MLISNNLELEEGDEEAYEDEEEILHEMEEKMKKEGEEHKQEERTSIAFVVVLKETKQKKKIKLF